MPEDTSATADETSADAQDDDTGQQTTGTQDSQTSDETSGAEEFDKDRAMALIRKQREELRTATRERKELDSLRAEKATRDEADLSDKQRLEKQATDLQAKLERQQREYQDLQNRSAVERQAAKLGIIDPDAAVKLLDWSALEYDDAGRPRDIDQALKDLVADKPYLAAPPQQQQSRQTTSPTNAGTRAQTPGQRRYAESELRDYAFYSKHREDIAEAYKSGRIDFDR